MNNCDNLSDCLEGSKDDQPLLGVFGNPLESAFGVKLWRATLPEALMYIASEPSLASAPQSGRSLVAVNIHRQRQIGEEDKVLQVSIDSTIDLFPPLGQEEKERLRAEWGLHNPDSDLRDRDSIGFLPLPVCNLSIEESRGHGPDALTANVSLSASTSELILLSLRLEPAAGQRLLGATFVGEIFQDDLKLTYCYPRFSEFAVEFIIPGKKVFDVLNEKLERDEGAQLAGTIDQLRVIWDQMMEVGSVERVLLSNRKNSRANSKAIDEANHEAFEYFIKANFKATNCYPADADELETVYLLKWQHRNQATDTRYSARIAIWTWISDAAVFSLEKLFESIDKTYVHEEYIDSSFTMRLKVLGAPELDNVLVTASSTEDQRQPPALIDEQGGVLEHYFSSIDPESVEIRYNAKFDFSFSSWPVIEYSWSTPVNLDSLVQELNPRHLIGRMNVLLRIVDAGKNVASSDLSDQDHLIINWTCRGPHLRSPLTDSSKLMPSTAAEILYPFLPDSRIIEISLSGFGIVQGHAVILAETTTNGQSDAEVIVDVSKMSAQLVELP